MNEWVFADAANTAVFTTRQVVEQGLPIRSVWHDGDDGGWQFLCGTTNAESDLRIVGLGEIVRLDPSVREVADLPRGWVAWRSLRSDAWHRAPRPARDAD